jgi:hypothetical protein
MKTPPAPGDPLWFTASRPSCRVTAVRVNDAPDPRFPPTVDVRGYIFGIDQTMTVRLFDLLERGPA